MSVGEALRTGIVSEARPVFMAGYGNELKLAIKACQAAQKRKKLIRSLLFGPPGTGKSTFALRLVSVMMAGTVIHPEFLCGIVAENLGTGDEISQLRERFASDDRPALLVIEGVERFFRELDVGTKEDEVYRWLNTLMTEDLKESESQRPRVLLLMSDFPTLLPLPMRSLVDFPIYLPPPNQDQVAAILVHKQIDSDLSRAVAVELYRRAQEKGVRYTGGGIATAAHALPVDLKTAPLEQIVTFIERSCDAVPEQDISDYEKKVALLRERSALLMKRWLPGLNDLDVHVHTIP